MMYQGEVPIRRVRPVRLGDSAVRTLKLLGENGVVVLVDEEERPQNILTSSDVEDLKTRSQSLAGDAPASALFGPPRPVVTVNISERLQDVTRTVANRGLSPGVVVVDDSGHYLGYIFNDDLRQRAEAFISSAEEQAKQVEQRYPD